MSERYKEDTFDKGAKEWHLMYQKGGKWLRYVQKKVSWWNAEMIKDFQLKSTKTKFKIVHYTELERREESDE